MHIPHIPLGDEECLSVFGGLNVRWLYQFKERFQTRADVNAFIEQVIKSTGKTKLETITKQVRPRGAFEGARYNLVDALFVEGSEINRFERDNLLNQPLPLQEQPAHDSLDNPGGDHPMQEQCFLDEMKRRKIPNFLEVPNGERASLIRFFVNHGLMGEEVANKAWQRLLDRKVVKSATNTRKVKA